MDNVEIKVTMGGGGAEVEPVLETLGLDPGGDERLAVAFIEDLSVGSRLPLLAAGVVLRVRSGSGRTAARERSTVKLRPCRRSQLPAAWLRRVGRAEPGDDLRIEQDWSGARRVLAASCDADRASGSIAAVRDRGRPIRRLFDERQARFLARCAPMRVNLDALTLLPEIRATRWEGVPLAVPADVAVRAERWQLDTLDFLELSIRVRSKKAQRRQGQLEDAVRNLGLTVDPAAPTKTSMVLDHLVDRLSSS